MSMPNETDETVERVAWTPGPWHLAQGFGTAKNHAVCAGMIILAKVQGNGYPIGKGWSPESEANARLMVAAPAMFEALTACRDFIEAMYGAGDDLCVQADKALAAAIRPLTPEQKD